MLITLLYTNLQNSLLTAKFFVLKKAQVHFVGLKAVGVMADAFNGYAEPFDQLDLSLNVEDIGDV